MITTINQYALIFIACFFVASCYHHQDVSQKLNLAEQKANQYISTNWEIKYPDYTAISDELKIAVSYELGLNGPKNFKGARRIYLALAKKGNLLATVKLGEYYELGLGGKKDLDLARQYYLAAAEKNYPPAMNNLGFSFHVWAVEPRDLDRAKYWYLKAAQLGDVFALVNLADLFQKLDPHEKRNNEVIVLLSQLVINHEIPRSSYILGLKLRYGSGVDQDIKMGEHLLNKSRYRNNYCGNIRSEARRYSNLDSLQALESAVFYYRYFAEICDISGASYLNLYVKILNGKRTN